MEQQQKQKAIVLTAGMLCGPDAKTAHGLIRGTDRYDMVAVIDDRYTGGEAGSLLDGINRGIPVFASPADAASVIPGIRCCIIGIATVGGALPAEFIPVIASCIEQGMDVVNGLHDFLCDLPELVQLAEKYGVTLTDIRKPKNKKDLHFWSGRIHEVTAPVIAVIGTDCALGKRTTCRMVLQACIKEGISAEMVFTGQTGWLQGGRFGFILDSTLNDFISGEVEHAICSCWEQTGAGVILVEGQSALRNPSGPCGAEILVSGNARYTILVHAPKRKHYEHLPAWGCIPDAEDEINLIRQYGSTVIALALNTEHCSAGEAADYQQQYSQALQIPVLLPLEQGVAAIVPIIKKLFTR